MATSFPSGLDSFTNPTAVDTLDSPPHDTQHADANDAIEALQAKVGVDSSAVTTSHDYILNQPTGLTLKSPLEDWEVVATAATGTVNIDVLTAGAHYYTSNASANWTYNFRGDGSNSLDSILAVGEAVTVSSLVTQGATAYYPTAFQVDGSAVTPEWQNAAAPSAGNANQIDTYTFTILKTGSATFSVFGSATTFG